MRHNDGKKKGESVFLNMEIDIEEYEVNIVNNR